MVKSEKQYKEEAIVKLRDLALSQIAENELHAQFKMVQAGQEHSPEKKAELQLKESQILDSIKYNKAFISFLDTL